MTKQEVITYIEQHAYIDDTVKDMCIEAIKDSIPMSDFVRIVNTARKQVMNKSLCTTMGMMLMESDALNIIEGMVNVLDTSNR